MSLEYIYLVSIVFSVLSVMFMFVCAWRRVIPSKLPDHVMADRNLHASLIKCFTRNI